ncbi:MAG: hypothetical protein LBF36_00900 [Mycoplasmataceae bacterium]|nr:hypothetical protein [Mycoplasmataceae bacterium]
MNKTIRHLLIFLCIFGIFLLFCLCCIKLHIITNCIFTSDGNTNSVIVNKHIHELIDNEDIKVCRINVNQTKYKAWLTFKDEENKNFSYWLSIDTSFAFNNQTSTINVDFGSLCIVKYMYYLTY